ncbi:MAG: hypothetical protein ACOYXB_00580 [Bacteroidota bacterium]
MKFFNQTQVADILRDCIDAGMDHAKILDYFKSNMSKSPGEFTKDSGILQEKEYKELYDNEFISKDESHAINLFGEKEPQKEL